MPDLEELRRRRLREILAKQQEQQVQQQMREEEIGAQIKVIVSQILEPEARERLANIRFSRPEYARQVEVLLIQLYQGGRLPKKLSDAEFRGILLKLTQGKREQKISQK